MKTVLSLFGYDMSPLAVVTRKSAKAFGIFNKLITKLEKVNSQIQKHKEEHMALIAQLQTDHDNLNLQFEKNDKLKNKLNEFTA